MDNNITNLPNMSLRMLGYYNNPGQFLKGETEEIEFAKALGELLAKSFKLFEDDSNDKNFDEALHNGIFVLRDKTSNLYAYWPKYGITRVTGVVYNKYEITVLPTKYKNWFSPGEALKVELLKPIFLSADSHKPFNQVGCLQISNDGTILKKCDQSAEGEIIIPDGVTTIGREAFIHCKNLVSIKIPQSVTTIGVAAFLGCTNLKSIIIPKGVQTIESQAFSNCHSLFSIEIPNTVTSILNNAFSNCFNLVTVKIPNSVTSVGRHIFRNCTNITAPIYNDTIFFFLPYFYQGAFSIPDGICHIAGGAFNDCHDLTHVHIPNSIKSVGRFAFKGCTSLTQPIYNKRLFFCLPNNFNGSFSIQPGIECIADSAFSGCNGLTSITIPNSITNIGPSAFIDCNNLASIVIPDNVTTIGSRAFKNCSNLTTISISKSLIAIKKSTFQGCTSLSSIKIPNSVISIGNSAFEKCTSLSSIEIPNSVNLIGNSAFKDCTHLSLMTILDSNKSIEKMINVKEDSFTNCEESCTLCVPVGTECVFQHHPVFKRFKEITTEYISSQNLNNLQN